MGANQHSEHDPVYASLAEEMCDFARDIVTGWVAPNVAGDVLKLKLAQALLSLEEQLEAVTRVAEAAKTYRDVRGDYSWVQMIQALDAWEHPNPASGSSAIPTDAEITTPTEQTTVAVANPASVPPTDEPTSTANGLAAHNQDSSQDTRIGPAEVGGEVAPAPDRRRPASAEERVGGADNTERKP